MGMTLRLVGLENIGKIPTLLECCQSDRPHRPNTRPQATGNMRRVVILLGQSDSVWYPLSSERDHHDKLGNHNPPYVRPALYAMRYGRLPGRRDLHRMRQGRQDRIGQVHSGSPSFYASEISSSKLTLLLLIDS